MGDTETDFTEWYRLQYPRLVASLLLVAGDLDQAQDAANEACTRALARWKRVQRMDSPNGWVYRVGLNVLRRRHRRSEIERRILSRQAPTAPVPPPAGEAWHVVRQLPARQRTVVVLRFVADLTEEQVGRAMGITRSTVSSALTDARRALGRLLDDNADAVEADRA